MPHKLHKKPENKKSANDLLIDLHLVAKKFSIYELNKKYTEVFNQFFGDNQNFNTISDVFANIATLNPTKNEKHKEFLEKAEQLLQEYKYSEYSSEVHRLKSLFYKSRFAYFSTRLASSYCRTKDHKEPSKALSSESVQVAVREFVSCSAILGAMQEFVGKKIDLTYEDMRGNLIETSILVGDRSSVRKHGPSSFIDSFYIMDAVDAYTKEKVEVPLNLIFGISKPVIMKLQSNMTKGRKK